jgi:hypothetical protein
VRRNARAGLSSQVGPAPEDAAFDSVTIHHLGDAQSNGAAAHVAQDRPHVALSAAAAVAGEAAVSGNAAALAAALAEAGSSSKHSSQFVARRLLTFAGILVG